MWHFFELTEQEKKKKAPRKWFFFKQKEEKQRLEYAYDIEKYVSTLPDLSREFDTTIKF